MSTIHVTAALLTMGDDRADQPDPEAQRALDELVETGHSIRVVGPERGDLTEGPGWLLTADRSECTTARSLGLRSILVGPHTDADRHAVERCDFVARDIRDAVLRVLAAEAMDPHDPAGPP
jgi:hypothetical protein